MKSRQEKESARKVYEEKKNFAGKVNKIAQVLVRMVALKGLQPVVAEALISGLEEIEGIQ